MPELNRKLGLPLLVLYGLGTTIGAGIYALLSDIAQTAGSLAPWSFLLASALAALTALSFAELSSRYPKAGATPLYIERGFSSPSLATLVGLLLVCSASTSGAALINAMVGYAQVFTSISRETIIVASLVSVTAIALWGIGQSAWIAALITLVEVGGVLWMSGLAGSNINPQSADWLSLLPSTQDSGVIFSGAVLSFYAYIGFEDMVEVAEEVKNPSRTMPRAILITLCVTSLLYVVLMTSTQLAVGVPFLQASSAPFADLYRELTGKDPVVFMLIGLLAIVNGVLIQIIMASRVLYGLAQRQELPSVLARVSEKTQTPVIATLVVATAILTLALAGSLGDLAGLTSLIMLSIFGLANLSLVMIKSREARRANADLAPLPMLIPMLIPMAVPMLGALVCFAFVAKSLYEAMAA